jgi:hypothetical protein
MIGMGLSRSKCNNKRAEKGFIKLLSGRRRVHFLAKKCCVKCAEKAIPEAKAEKGLIM